MILTHWGRVTHICISKLTIIGSDNGLSPSQRQAINWSNGGISLIWNLGTNFSWILSEVYTFSFKKIHLKMSSRKWRPFCLGLNVLNVTIAQIKIKEQGCIRPWICVCMWQIYLNDFKWAHPTITEITTVWNQQTNCDISAFYGISHRQWPTNYTNADSLYMYHCNKTNNSPWFLVHND